MVSTGSNAVIVYRTLAVTDGVPTFAPPQTYFVGTSPVSVTVADISGNGIPDLLVANQGSNDVSVIFGSYDANGDWAGIAGPRLKSGGDGPIAVEVADLTGNGILDLVIFNGGSGTVTLLPGVGGGFFDDQEPQTLLNLGGAVVQAPTFVGTTGVGYAVIANGNLVQFDLNNTSAGAPVVFAGQQVVAASAGDGTGRGGPGQRRRRSADDARKRPDRLGAVAGAGGNPRLAQLGRRAQKRQRESRCAGQQPGL